MKTKEELLKLKLEDLAELESDYWDYYQLIKWVKTGKEKGFL